MAGTPRTDFSRYSHTELVRMLHRSDPDTVTRTGDLWAAIGRSLHDRASDLEQQLRAFDGVWQGGAAAQYHTMIGNLADGLRQGGTVALTLRDLVYHASDTLQTAWRAMPAPVAIPLLAPDVLAAATAPLLPDPTRSPAATAALAQ
ncbi:MAG TPA: WXG100 family type VII secretion target, partial [Rugosimonospora sp.]|nr:WXG100 family type VII secretion target [Rugosimonospora sp.]